MARGKRVGVRVQAAVGGAVLRKALRADLGATNTSVGEVVSLMSTDAAALCRFFTFSHQLWYIRAT